MFWVECYASGIGWVALSAWHTEAEANREADLCARTYLRRYRVTMGETTER
jgi:hypothetical protein